MQNYLENSSHSLISKLDELKTMLDNNSEGIKEHIDNIEKEWQEIEKIWAMLVLHEDIDKIEVQLIELKNNFEASKDLDNKSEIAINIDQIQFWLRSYKGHE